MNLINMISCRERAWSLPLLLLTSESCGAWETGGSFIVSLLPGARDCRSSCLVLPGPSLKRPACHRENRTSVLTSRTQRPGEGFPLPLPKPQKNFFTETSAGMMFSQTNFFITPEAFPSATWQLSGLQGLLIGLNCMARQGAPEHRERCRWRVQLGVDASSRVVPVSEAGQPQLKAISCFRKKEDPKCSQLAPLNLCSPIWA